MAGVEEENLTETQENGNSTEKVNTENSETLSTEKLVKLPLSRIKTIIKSDPAVTLASQEAVIVLTKATELFIQMLSKDASSSTTQGKRKTLQRKDLDHIIDTRDSYIFLEGTLD